MPLALKCGISYREFWRLTPAAISAIEKAYVDGLKEKRDYEEQMIWLSGQYNMLAIGASMSKKIKYPNNPVQEREMKRTDFTEQEKEKYVNSLFGYLEEMQNAFEAAKKTND